MKLINSRKRRIGFHLSYPQYPNKINIYESFSNITDAHIKLPQVDPSHLGPKVNTPVLQSFSRACCNQNVILYS